MSSIPSTPFVAQTLDSILAPSTSTRTQRGHSRPSSHVPDQERLRQQRTEAAEIMRNLGLGSSQTTPQKSPRKKEEGTARPSRVVSQGERSRPASSASNVSSLVSHSALEKRAEDQEYLISTLRAQISGLTNERNALKVEVAKLKEGGGKTTLQAREVEELTRQFAAQEKLLEGYQKENEKCMVTIEELRKKERLYGQALRKLYGEEYESHIQSTTFSVSHNHSNSVSYSSLTSSFTSPPLTGRSLQLSSASSNAQRNGSIFVGPNAHLRMGFNSSTSTPRSGRSRTDSFGNSSTLGRGNVGELSTIEDQSYESSAGVGEDGHYKLLADPVTNEPDGIDVSPSKSLRNLRQDFDPSALMGYLEQVHMLVKGMERRFIEREGELEELEKKAQGEAEKKRGT